MKRLTILLAFTLLLNNILNSQTSVLDYVNPFIGTGGHGHTFPGVCAPFGMMQLSPDTRLEGWDGCSGYHYSDSIVYGFSHTHLSGTGIPDYGDVLLMPTTGELRLNNGADNKPGYHSRFSKNSEKATLSMYSVNLLDYEVDVRLSATAHCGVHEYTFPKGKINKNIIIDLRHRDELIDADFRQVSATAVQGFRISKAWATNQPVYFYMEFSSPMTLVHTVELNGKNLAGGLRCKKKKKNTITVKIGISPISIENAKENLLRELPKSKLKIDEVATNLAELWKKELGRITIESDNIEAKTNFYTALYHLYQVPNLFQDVNNQYLGMDFKPQLATGYQHYTVFSLWDTYRAAHPFYTILQPERTNDFVKTFLNDYKKSGALPMWKLAANETWCMIGNHAIPVIVDAYLKGLLKDIDAHQLLDAMIKTTEIDHFGQKEYTKYQYVPAELEHESVSKTVEYAYDDYCIAMMAKALGETNIYRKYISRAQHYKNIFNPLNGFSQAKINSTWVSNFRPDEVNSHYTEGNAWHYSFSAPQDMQGWMSMLGGKTAAEAKLDALFNANSATSGREQPDLTGFIGQYVQGNEPSHHIAYLYNFVGKPHKTQETVHQILTKFYKNSPDGLIGNEDCGQMSAWYTFGAMGFYPVNPCGGQYIIGTPLFEKTQLQIDNQKEFTITAKFLSEKNIYIESATLNGKPLERTWIMHEEIMKGGTLEFVMTDKPTHWGTNEAATPSTSINDFLIIPVPFVSQGERSFKDKTTLAFGCADKNASLYYKILDDKNYYRYTRPFEINETGTFKIWAVHNTSKQLSDTATATFFKIPVNRTITLKNKYAPQYAAGGDNALIDFIKGGKNYHTGTWQGYQEVDCEAIVDLEHKKNINTITVGVLQDQNAWIFAPTVIEFYISNDGNDFEHLQTIKVDIDEHQDGTIIKDIVSSKATKARYVKIIAKNRGLCPTWHKGAAHQGKAWIFLDEIEIK